MRKSSAFWSKVDKRGPIISPKLGRCWIWTGAKSNGYGPTKDAWKEAGNKPPLDGEYLCHKCDNPPCVRPSHLFVGTPTDNVADMYAKGRNKPGDGGWNKDGAAKRKKELSERMRGNKLALGNKLSPEHVEKIRSASLGNTRGSGYKHTPEAIEKIRNAHLERKRSPETLRKMREARERRRLRSRAS